MIALYLNLHVWHIHTGCRGGNMDMYGCLWVRMSVLGCRGMEIPPNKVNRGPGGRSGHVCSPYGRGNFPEHHVWRGYACKGKDGCAWAKMMVDGCNGMHRQRQEEKRHIKKQKWSCSAYFAMHGHDEKYRRVHTSQNMHYARVMGWNSGKERGAR